MATENKNIAYSKCMPYSNWKDGINQQLLLQSEYWKKYENRIFSYIIANI